MTAHRYDANESVTNYLTSLVWDGVARLDRWLIDCAGANDTPPVREAGRRMLTAAVCRARHPGCRLDQVLILEGPQGCGKSDLLRVLAVKETWFTDEFSLNPRELMEATEGKWIVELANMRPSNIAALKACLSRQHDEARRAYGHKSMRTLRQFVIIGTANKTGGYLRDSTGNRRFWPVRVQHLNLEKLRADRDQLWAEASTAEALGESIRLDAHESAAAQETWLNAKPNLDRRPLVKT